MFRLSDRATVPSSRASKFDVMILYGRPDPDEFCVGFCGACGFLSRDEARARNQDCERGQRTSSGVGLLRYVPRRL